MHIYSIIEDFWQDNPPLVEFWGLYFSSTEGYYPKVEVGYYPLVGGQYYPLVGGSQVKDINRMGRGPHFVFTELYEVLPAT